MSNYKDLVKNFSGVVHIADIQEEFDRLLKGLATLQGKMNELENVSDLDFTKGKPSLSAKDFTLTLGGLKKILQVYNNKVIEEPIIVKLPNETNKYKAFPGLYCDEEVGITQTNDNVLTLTSSNTIHLYQDSNGDLVTTITGEHIVCSVKTDRSDNEISNNAVINLYIDNNYCSLIPDTIPTLKMTTKTFTFDQGESKPSSGSYFILPKIGARASAGSFIMGGTTLCNCGGNVGGNRAKRITWFYDPIWYPVQANKLSYSMTGVTYMKYLRYKFQ